MATVATDSLRVELSLGRPSMPLAPETLTSALSLGAPAVLLLDTGGSDTARLPVDIERGAVGGPAFVTRVSTSRSGREQRNALVLARQRWEIGYGLASASDYAMVRDFFYARRGRLRSFRFRDWTDYQVTDEVYGTGDGVTTTFQLSRDYDGYARAITRPVDPITTTPPATSVSYETGQVVFASPPASGVSLTWTGEFDVPVRFDDDELAARVTHTDAISVDSITLLEVIE